jgi:hypothetical protein
MRSVADDQRRQTREEDLARTPAERIELALALGDADRELFQAATGVDAETASRLLQRRKQVGRRRSRCHEEIIG